MKVDGSFGSIGFNNSFPSIVGGEASKSGQQGIQFRQMMQSASSRQDMKLETVTSWIKDIGGKQQDLERDMSSTNLNAYKQAIRDFLSYYVDKELSLEQHTVKIDRFYSKSVRVVRVLDETLDKMTDGLLQSQLGRLDLLKKTGDIQGLLISLTV